MNKDKIKKLLLDEKLSIEEVIDAVIELNSIVGVGLYSLGDDLRNYCRN